MPISLEDFPLLRAANLPAELRALPENRLGEVCTELREYLIRSVATRGGHFAAGLGTVELTVALHYVFNTPSDRLVWDVGHQAYPHKILTGRRDRIRTLRQAGGLFHDCLTPRTIFGRGPSGAATTPSATTVRASSPWSRCATHRPSMKPSRVRLRPLGDPGENG